MRTWSGLSAAGMTRGSLAATRPGHTCVISGEAASGGFASCASAIEEIMQEIKAKGVVTAIKAKGRWNIVMFFHGGASHAPYIGPIGLQSLPATAATVPPIGSPS